jgi:sugar lactone lactonase YvrE
VAAGSFSCDELINDFRVTEDGGTIYILDSRNIITVWNTHTFEKLATVALHDDVEQMMITGGGNLLVRCYNNLVACYDREGTQLWQAEGSWVDMAFWGDRETVVLEEAVYTLTGRCCSFFVLEARTGAVLREIRELPVVNLPLFLREIYATGSKLAVATSTYPTYTLNMLDLEQGTLETLGQDYTYIYNSVTTNDGNLVTLVQKEELSGMQGNYMGITITAPETLQLQCYTPAGKLLWETDITAYCYSNFRTLEIIPGRDDILCQTGNLFLIVDSATGAVKAGSEATGYVMWTEVGAQSTRAVLDSGAVGSFLHEEGYCGFMPCTKDDLVCVDVWEGDYYVADELSTQVTVYRYTGDENWISIGSDGYLYSDEWHARDGLLALGNYSKLQMVSADEGRLLWEKSLSQPEIIGFSQDGRILWASCNRGTTLLRIDALTGNAEEIPLPNMVDGISPYTGEPAELTVDIGYEDMMLCDGYVYYVADCYANDQMYLFRCDAATGQGDYWALYNWDDSYSGYHYGKLAGVTDEFAVVWNQVDNTVLEFSIQTAQSQVIASDVLYMPAFRNAEQGKYLLGTSAAVSLRIWGGGAERNMPLTDCRAVSVSMYEEYILALGDDGYLYRFDMAGNQLSKYGLTRYNTYISTVESPYFDPNCITWDRTADGSLILGIDRSGNLIDCETWKGRAWIPSYYTYLENSNRVLLRDPANSYGLGTFPLYTTEDIITMAQEALNGYELSETLREAYGLD